MVHLMGCFINNAILSDSDIDRVGFGWLAAGFYTDTSTITRDRRGKEEIVQCGILIPCMELVDVERD